MAAINFDYISVRTAKKKQARLELVIYLWDNMKTKNIEWVNIIIECLQEQNTENMEWIILYATLPKMDIYNQIDTANDGQQIDTGNDGQQIDFLSEVITMAAAKDPDNVDNVKIVAKFIVKVAKIAFMEDINTEAGVNEKVNVKDRIQLVFAKMMFIGESITMATVIEMMISKNPSDYKFIGNFIR